MRMTTDRADLVAEGYEAAMRLRGLLESFPLAFRSLWDKPEPMTSQRRSVQALMDRSVKCLAEVTRE